MLKSHAGTRRTERLWVGNLLRRSERAQGQVADLDGFREQLALALREDPADSPESQFVACQASRAEFAAVIGQYAIDGLTEAQAMLYAVARLPAAVQMPVMRVLIDEFGCGNLRASHSELFRELLRELRMPVELQRYLAGTRPELFDFVNVYHWLTRRAPAMDYYLGALAYTEAVVPLAYRAFAQACDRLGIASKVYFTEHIHIDEYHARDALCALRLMDATEGIDFGKAWQGVELVRDVGRRAFQAAVDAARKGERAWTAA
jgi:hypothetical protein